MTSRRRWARRCSVGLVLASLSWIAAPTATAETPRCSYGDAAALFQALEPLFLHQPRETILPACQYRVWFDGEQFTFQEDDWFLAGVAYLWDYEAAGITRAEAIADLEKIGSRLWLAEIGPGGVIGAPVEQPLEETSYRNVIDPDFGRVVYRQDGIILQLPPGDYLSTYEETYEGEVVFLAEVTLHILPTG